MAHTLSSQQYSSSSSSTNYQQCSPSTSSHQGSMYSSSYHRSHPTVSVHGGGNYQQSNKLRLSDFKGKSWHSFGEALASESSDDDTDTEVAEDPLALPSTSSTRHNRGSVVRLKRRDYHIYGYRPETDPFAVVTCRHCRKVLKSTALRRHIDMRHEPVVKLDRIDKISGEVGKISVENKSEKRHRHVPRKTTPPPPKEIIPAQIEVAPQPPALPVLPIQPKQQQQQQSQPPPLITTTTATVVQQQQQQQPSESSSASNSPQPRRKKRKQTLEPIQQQPTQQVTTTETFQAAAVSMTATASLPPPIVTQAPTPCRIIMSSSPPPLAPITNEAPPSVWIVTPSPAVIIDGSFVVKPLEAEIDTEIDLKDLKVLKPAVKEQQPETATSLTASNWYTTQPRPLALNTFNMRKINAQRYVMATQRKLIELGRTLRQDDKITNAVVKPQPKTWSFIERSQVFIPFRVTH
ncbi:hypothetical protein PVAND_015093 [Polypedilum vanderplanki]|uniref:Uncharacterized protein n=1 Tax=Polypedilum vanderplanki TaxID=319348 RepID=A0A9J6BBY0_POLVA|nr:hypothetical protein PVAND_015093 [Polypedilum vanderplanki]